MPKLFNPLENTRVLELIAADNHESSQNGSAVNIVGYDGRIGVILQAGNPAGEGTNTLDVKLQHCESGLADDFEDIAGAAFDQVAEAAGEGVQIIHIDTQAVEGYIRAVSTHGTGVTAAYGVIAIAVPRENLNNDDASLE